jgi:hypothetical protein
MIYKTLHRKLRIEQHEPLLRIRITPLLSSNSHGDDCKTFEVMTNHNRNPWCSIFFFISNSPSRKSWYEPQALEYRIKLRDIYPIYRRHWNISTYKRRVYNGEKWNHIFFRNVSFLTNITVNFYVCVMTQSRPSCIYGVLYIQLNGIGPINIITEFELYLVKGHHLYRIGLASSNFSWEVPVLRLQSGS